MGNTPNKKVSTKSFKTKQLGTATEMLISSILINEERELYIPAVDDRGIDLIIRTNNFVKGNGDKAENFEFQEIQIKSLSEGGLFAFHCKEPKPNYWFIFYVQSINTFWLMNSLEVHSLSNISQGEKSFGMHSIQLATRKNGCNKKFDNFLVKNFNKIP